MELVPSSEAAGSKEVVDAIESFLRHNGFDLAGPATIRLAHIRDDQWAVKPRMVLEADLKYEDTQLSSLGEHYSIDTTPQRSTENSLDNIAQSREFTASADSILLSLTPNNVVVNEATRVGHDSLSGFTHDASAFNLIPGVIIPTMEQSNAVSSPWLLNADATDPLSPISGLTNFMSGEEAQLIDAFSEPRSPQVPCRSDWYSDTGKPTLAIDHTHRRASRSLTPTSEAFDRIYDAQTLELNDANMLDSTSAVSFANTVNFSDTSSSESMFLRSDTNPTVTAASTPPTSGTAESPRISRSSSSKSISTPVRGHKTSHKARQVAVSASKNIMREDYLQYLRTEVSSWISGKQWLVNADVRPEQAPMEASTYTELELAYSTVCKLDTRISIDVIRSRVALIRLHREYVRTCDSWDASGLSKSATDVGRGKTSFIIDHILRRIHQDWHSLDSSAREQLRARFHSQKRFGKRWLLMMEALGPGILLICSHRLANMIRNSAVTIQMLEDIAQRVSRSQGKAARALQILKPVATSMFSNIMVDATELASMIQELETLEEESFE